MNQEQLDFFKDKTLNEYYNIKSEMAECNDSNKLYQQYLDGLLNWDILYITILNNKMHDIIFNHPETFLSYEKIIRLLTSPIKIYVLQVESANLLRDNKILQHLNDNFTKEQKMELLYKIRDSHSYLNQIGLRLIEKFKWPVYDKMIIDIPKFINRDNECSVVLKKLIKHNSDFDSWQQLLIRAIKLQTYPYIKYVLNHYSGNITDRDQIYAFARGEIDLELVENGNSYDIKPIDGHGFKVPEDKNYFGICGMLLVYL